MIITVHFYYTYVVIPANKINIKVVPDQEKVGNCSRATEPLSINT